MRHYHSTSLDHSSLLLQNKRQSFHFSSSSPLSSPTDFPGSLTEIKGNKGNGRTTNETRKDKLRDHAHHDIVEEEEIMTRATQLSTNHIF